MILKFLNILANGKTMSTIKFLIFFILTIIVNQKTFSMNIKCNEIYDKCLNNIPNDLIISYKDFNFEGLINKNNVNLRTLPIVDNNSTFIIKKLKKNEKIQIHKVYYLKGNTQVKLKLLNSNEYHIVNNHKFNKWYFISQNDISGFVFVEYIDKIAKVKDYNRYRHVNSVDWTINTTDLQQNIEITINKINDNLLELVGYAWHFDHGYIEIKKVFKKLHQNKNIYYSEKNKIFLFDQEEIYLDFEKNIFTGVYKILD